jgi:hypothetical protein
MYSSFPRLQTTSPFLPANLTAYEILAFLPNSLRCPGLVYRFASNWGTRRGLWSIINAARDFEKEWNVDRCGVTVNKTMTQAGYEGWVITRHHQWHEANKADWDESSSDVTGLSTQATLEADKTEQNVPFKDLALSVRRMPEGGEALDLTRMVRYCDVNSTARWLYPRDDAELLDLLGGPLPVRGDNLDHRTFESWDNIIPPPPRTRSIDGQDLARQALESRYKKNKTVSTGLGTPVSDMLPRESTPAVGAQKKKRGRPRKYVRVEEAEVEVKAALHKKRRKGWDAQGAVHTPSGRVCCATPGRHSADCTLSSHCIRS